MIEQERSEPRWNRLSKSDFKRGWTCPCTLWHRRCNLKSRHEADDFMRMLAEGGFMFERLVRQAFPGEVCSISSIVSEADLAAMAGRLREAIEAESGVLHEVTVEHAGLRCRIDMIRVVGRRIELCEIKAKSFFASPVDGAVPDVVKPDHPDRDGKPQITGERPVGAVRSKWLPYVIDVVYQVMVLRAVVEAFGAAFEDVVVEPRLVLVNKAVFGHELDGFANLLPVRASAEPGGDIDYDFVTPPAEGDRSPIIIEVDIAGLCEDLEEDARCKPATFELVGTDLGSVARRLLSLMREEDPEFEAMAAKERGIKCAKCEFNLGRPDDGFSRCWGDRTDAARRLLSLYYGSQYQGFGRGENWVDLAIDCEIFQIGDLPYEEGEGSRKSIRARQIGAERNGRVVVDPEGARQIRSAIAPAGDTTVLWFVDFETATGCLPHYRDVKPYEVLPFQFSVHAVPVRDGVPTWERVEHREWLLDDRQSGDGVDLDLAFVEALSDALTRQVDGIEASGAPVFHWSSHERTVLRKIRTRLSTRGASLAADRREAANEFLDSMLETGQAGRADGRLVDMMAKAAEPTFFHPLQKGRFSIKCLLPAICSDQRYRDMVRRLVPELAADGGVLSPDETWDPYKLLPPVSDSLAGPRAKENDGADDEENTNEFGDLQCGTAAMRAFAQMRYRRDDWGKPVKIDQAHAIRQALLRYCKLDTAAMVVVWAFATDLVKEHGHG